MLSLTVKTKLKPDEVMKKASQYFLSEGMKATEQDINSVLFSGGGGYVRLSAYPDGKTTTVDMETREWEYQVKEFGGQIK